MKRPFDATFRPLTRAQREPPPLPLSIQYQLRAATEIDRVIQVELFKNPKRGPNPRPVRRPLVWFSANDQAELDWQLDSHSRLIGSKARGNKRIGKAALYADLFRYFLLLQQHGIALPRNKNLSRSACQFGLGEILRRHSCTTHSDAMLQNNGAARRQVAVRLDRVFARVAAFVGKHPRINQ